MKRMWDDNEIVKIAKESAKVTPEALTENMEGGVGLSVDLNETNDKVSVGIDLTGGSAGNVLAINAAGTDVEWVTSGSGGGMQMDLLWENARPMNSFSSQTQQLTSDGYKLLLVVFNFSSGNSDNKATVVVDNTIKEAYYGAQQFSEQVQNGYKYRIVQVLANAMYFGHGYACNFTATSAPSSTDAYMIPIKIYGIK